MKRLAMLFAVMTVFAACSEEKGDTRTPKGIIIEAVRALSEERAKDFAAFLSGAAAQKYSSPQMQESLLNSLGDVRKLKLSSERVVSHNSHGNTTTTVSQIDVLKSGKVAYVVTTQCAETRTTTSSTHEVCRDLNPPSHHTYNPPSHDSNPPRYDGSNDDHHGGYITPGSSHEPDYDSGSNGDDGHKPGNQDPDRPPRFLTEWSMNGSSHYDQYGRECHDETNTYTNTSVSCKIIDLQ